MRVSHAPVTLGACTTGTGCLEASGGITMGNMTFTSNLSTSISIKSPGVLAVDSDSKGYPLTVATSTVGNTAGPGTLTISMDKSGAFNASATAPGTYSFTYNAQNSQGTLSASTATVTLIFPTASGLKVSVKDGKTGTAITDYRWIIEEDRTFYIDPTKTTNTGGTTIVPTFGTNFHTSYMPVVAEGCVGPTGAAVACESGQTVLGIPSVCDIGDGLCRPGTQQAALDPSQVHLDPNQALLYFCPARRCSEPV